MRNGYSSRTKIYSNEIIQRFLRSGVQKWYLNFVTANYSHYFTSFVLFLWNRYTYCKEIDNFPYLSPNSCLHWTLLHSTCTITWKQLRKHMQRTKRPGIFFFLFFFEKYNNCLFFIYQTTETNWRTKLYRTMSVHWSDSDYLYQF